MNDKKNSICVLDIGTSKITAIVGELVDNGKFQIYGVGENTSHGVRKGLIVDIKKAREDIGMALTQAEHMSGVRIGSVVAIISTEKLKCNESKGVAYINSSRVTDKDIQEATNMASQFTLPPGLKIFHSITKCFILDDIVVENPIDMCGKTLQVHIVTITGSDMIEENIKSCLSSVYIGNGSEGEVRSIELQEIIIQPMASSMSVLIKDETELGVCCIDIGAGTSDVCVYINKAIYYVSILPFAGDNITKDISRGLLTPIASAERLKKEVGSARLDLTEEEQQQNIDTPSIGNDNLLFRTSLYTLNEIIYYRIEEILEIIRNDLNVAGLYDQISGIVLTGGTANLIGIEALARTVFDGKTVRTGLPQVEYFMLHDQYKSPKYSACLGGLIYQKRYGFLSRQNSSNNRSSNSSGKQKGIFNNILSKITM